MKALWRISKHSDLEGLGGEKSDGRWHTGQRGKRIVYLSEHPALALMEVLVNLKGNPKLFPDSFFLMKITAGDSVSTEVLQADSLPKNWREESHATRLLGDAWLAARRSALLAVPSAPSPESLNYLFNPLHAHAKEMVIEWSRWVDYDKRLFRLSVSGASERT